jgi:Tol biopolymer transport system component
LGWQHPALSSDGTEIAFSMQDKSGLSKVWIAPTDRRSAATAIKSQTSDDCAFFLPNGDLICGRLKESRTFYSV